MAFGFGKKQDGKIGPVTVKDVVGKLFNAPNTALGVTYGALGQAVGEIGHAVGLQEKRPKVFLRDNALQFTNNPFGGVGAITIGNATVWRDDPYDPQDRRWHTNGAPDLEKGHTYPEHETQHTYQGERLGPLYLPYNIAGGLNALAHGQDWHGSANWAERGPQGQPPQPWPPRRPR